MLKRILSVLGANLLGQAITVIIQVVSVPLFLHFWGAQLYGEWLVLTALPSYFIVSGTGIGSVAGNTMQKHMVTGEENEALAVLQSAWVVTLTLSIGLLLLIVPITLMAPFTDWVNIVQIGENDARVALVVLTLYILLTLQMELLSGVYRASGKFARSITLMNIFRLIEFGGLVVVISLRGGAIAVSVLYLVVRMLGFMYMLFDLKQFSWPRLGFQYASRSIVRSELVPTFSFLGFPLGNACLIQGMTTVVGIRLGPSAVVVFSTVRVLTNFIKQFSSTIYYSVWPEFSTSLASGQLGTAKRLHRNAFQITVLFCIVSIVFLSLFGQLIFKVWTGGKIEIDANFYLLMLLSSVPSVLWNLSSYVSISINRHANIALAYLTSAAISLIVAFYLIPYYGLSLVPVVIILSDFFMLCFVLKRSFQIVEDGTRQFLWFMISNLPFKKMPDHE